MEGDFVLQIVQIEPGFIVKQVFDRVTEHLDQLRLFVLTTIFVKEDILDRREIGPVGGQFRVVHPHNLFLNGVAVVQGAGEFGNLVFRHPVERGVFAPQLVIIFLNQQRIPIVGEFFVEVLLARGKFLFGFVQDELLLHPTVDVVAHQCQAVFRGKPERHSRGDFRGVELVLIDLREHRVVAMFAGGAQREAKAA